MIIIGSHAMNRVLGRSVREPGDVDLIGTYSEFQTLLDSLRKEGEVKAIRPVNAGKKMIFRFNGKWIEFEIAWPNSSAEMMMDNIHNWTFIKEEVKLTKTFGIEVFVPNLNFLYMLKMSHRFKKNTKYFEKTRLDIMNLRTALPVIPQDMLELYVLRQKETYDYGHPKLNVSKKEFFSDAHGIEYVYDHDDIHEAVKHLDKPAYKYYISDDIEVFTNTKMFDVLPEAIRVYGVLEEAYVLALERSQIPYRGSVDSDESFRMALEKVCTSITSGWFREYAWEHYDLVMYYYKRDKKNLFDYVSRFWIAEYSGMVKKV